MGAVRQEPIIGFLNNNMVFFVSLMGDDSYVFAWQNGDELTETEKKNYCIQIVNAQNKLENVQMFILRGRGMAQFGFWNNWPYSENKAGVETKHQTYRSSGKIDRPVNAQNCKIRMKADLRL